MVRALSWRVGIEAGNETVERVENVQVGFSDVKYSEQYDCAVVVLYINLSSSQAGLIASCSQPCRLVCHQRLPKIQAFAKPSTNAPSSTSNSVLVIRVCQYHSCPITSVSVLTPLNSCFPFHSVFYNFFLCYSLRTTSRASNLP